jgi:hypothetical protein
MWTLCGCATLSPAVSTEPAESTGADTVEPSPSQADDMPAKPTRAPLTDTERLEIRGLLDDADRAIDRDHLTYPARNSAMDLYDRVLLLDPDNEDARHGLERIVERYLEMALSAADQARFPQAGAMLDRARLVDPGHPGIAPAEMRIRLLNEADRRRFPLEGQALSDREVAAIDVLRQAGLASRGDGCRAEIVARNDAEGRWIYQQMSEAQGQVRIRAELTIGNPPRVEVWCLPEPYQPSAEQP